MLLHRLRTHCTHLHTIPLLRLITIALQSSHCVFLSFLCLYKYVARLSLVVPCWHCLRLTPGRKEHAICMSAWGWPCGNKFFKGYLTQVARWALIPTNLLFLSRLIPSLPPVCICQYSNVLPGFCVHGTPLSILNYQQVFFKINIVIPNHQGVAHSSTSGRSIPNGLRSQRNNTRSIDS